MLIDADQISEWELANPQPYNRDAYQGAYADHSGTPEEPFTGLIRDLASSGLENFGEHGPVAAMGVPRDQLPSWDNIQFVTGQLASVPQLDDVEVGTHLVVGPNAEKPLTLEIPLIVSDMSFGALSEEAKVSLAKGAELAGTGICSGEGGMLPEEQAENSRYFYELASASHGTSLITFRHSTSRAVRVRRQAQAGICREPKYGGRSPRCVAFRRASPLCPLLDFRNGTALTVFVILQGRSGSAPAGFPSVSNYRRSMSRPISMPL